MQFKKHYTREEARALLPRVRRWLKQLVELRSDFEQRDKRLKAAMLPGCDMGGEIVNAWVRIIADIKDLSQEFREREIQIKDIDRGLIDFPAIMDGREVFLCWEDGEEDIEYWHDLESGYAGRQKL